MGVELVHSDPPSRTYEQSDFFPLEKDYVPPAVLLVRSVPPLSPFDARTLVFEVVKVRCENNMANVEKRLEIIECGRASASVAEAVHPSTP
jgi:hypothetical protein